MEVVQAPESTDHEATVPQERFGHRAMLMAAAVGFAVGVVITLAASPLLSALSSNKHKHTALPTPVAMTQQQVQQQVHQLTDSALSFYYLGKHRVQSVSVVPDVEQAPPLLQQPVIYDARIQFGLNPNPAGTKFQIGGAESDCFLVLKALYSHNLPLNDIDLLGTFTFPNRRSMQVVLHAGSNPYVESKFAPWKSLPRTKTLKVWEALAPHWISRKFQQYVPK
jgi:hypothetical protein